jgi:hypothetical protein
LKLSPPAEIFAQPALNRLSANHTPNDHELQAMFVSVHQGTDYGCLIGPPSPLKSVPKLRRAYLQRLRSVVSSAIDEVLYAERHVRWHTSQHLGELTPQFLFEEAITRPSRKQSFRKIATVKLLGKYAPLCIDHPPALMKTQTPRYDRVHCPPAVSPLHRLRSAACQLERPTSPIPWSKQRFSRSDVSAPTRKD